LVAVVTVRIAISICSQKTGSQMLLRHSLEAKGLAD
jgi:hypothetical protein